MIEASGVAYPGEIARVLNDEAMRPYAVLELIITMLDCDNEPLYKPDELKLIREQIRYSNIVLLTKLDQANADDIDSARALVKEINPNALIVDDVQNLLSLDFLLGEKYPHAEHGEKTNQHTNANDLFRSWNYSSEDPISEGQFQALLNQLPLKVRFEFQMVGKTAQVQPNGECKIY